jgi:amidase
MPTSPLCFSTARDLVRRMRAKELSAREVLEAHLAQIARVNPQVNAICTLVVDQAMDEARAADEALVKGKPTGPLHGLPVAIKDLAITKGIRTTFGSRIYKDFVPDQDDLVVERLRKAGAIVIGKTNTPEFGAGAQTFNEVFGETHNPYDLSKTCGGSSGGAAVSLACGMLPIADGGDLGGSLRIPANFCNVVGFRPSPGRVPSWPSQMGWYPLTTQGPMARNVEDLALMLSAIAGPDPRAPMSLTEPGESLARPLGRDFKGVRVAWSRNLGRYPVEPRVTKVLDAQRAVLERLGCIVEEAEPDVAGADQIFQVLRAWRFALAHGEELKRYRGLMKDTVIWNTEQGLKLDGMAVSRAEEQRTLLYHRLREFMSHYEYLLLPVTPVPPFPIEQRYISEINGVKLPTYVDWLALCYVITLTGHPAISVPAGFTPEGLPVGLQIVGRHQQDFAVLQLAHAFEQATRFGDRRPAVAE